MRARKKARAPATAETVREGPGSFQAGKLRRHGAYSKHLQAVYSGRDLIGFLLPHKQGVEAFTTDDQSLGIFPDQQTAAAAIPNRGRRA